MTEQQHLREIGERIEALLARFERTGGGRLRDDAEALVRAVTDLYGAGLERVLAIVGQTPELEAALCDDPVVAGLLVIHGLHPLGVAARIERALARIEGELGTAGSRARLDAVDTERGVAQVSVTGDVRRATPLVRQALLDAAPELLDVEVVAVAPVPVQVGRRQRDPVEAVGTP